MTKIMEKCSQLQTKVVGFNHPDTKFSSHTVTNLNDEHI